MIYIFFILCLQSATFIPHDCTRENVNSYVRKGTRGSIKIRGEAIKNNEVVLQFESGFDSTRIQVFNQDSLIFDQFLTTDPVLSTTHVGIPVNIDKNKEMKLFFLLPNEKVCSEVTVKCKYKLTLISRFNNEWYVSYTNFYPQYE